MIKLKVRKKGIVILPKQLREAAGIGEGDILEAEIVESGILLRKLKPKTVRVDPSLIDKLLSEEYELEEGSG